MPATLPVASRVRYTVIPAGGRPRPSTDQAAMHAAGIARPVQTLLDPATGGLASRTASHGRNWREDLPGSPPQSASASLCCTDESRLLPVPCGQETSTALRPLD